jgi:hypothetical protein
MSRIGRWGYAALWATVVAAVVGSAAGPEVVSRRLDETLVAAWKAAGRALGRRESAALGGLLDRDRARLRDARVLRNALAQRLQALEVRRSLAAGQAVGPDDFDDQASGCGVCRRREVASETVTGAVRLDDAIAALASAVARADRLIATAEALLRSREDDLLALRAWTDARQAQQELDGLKGDRSHWDDRMKSVAEVIASAARTAE